MAEDLKVPKQRAEVEVLLPGGAARQVVVFLSEFASTHSGRERLSDLLNGGEDFVPALDTLTGNMTFLGRQSIAAARVAPEWEPADETVMASEHELEVTLADGTVLHGRVRIVMPPERSRLLDYLNDAPPFLKLVERGSVALVNKRHIARVARVKE
jgi:hypothetical protein